MAEDGKFESAVVHYSAIEQEPRRYYPGSDEAFSHRAAFSPHFNLMRLGINHERLEPGRRTSWPHAEADEEEFIYVLEGEPDLWLDGHVRRLKPGDGVGFAAWPAYRVSSGELWSMQRRLNDCFRQQRFPYPGYASDVTVALSVFMGVNGQGGASTAPAIKR